METTDAHMRYGFLLFATDLSAVGRLAEQGERLGFDLIGCGDAPSVIHDPYVALTLAASSTRRVQLGTTVTNPQSRHPLLLANLASSLELLAPGRSFLGLSVGNAGVRQAGASRATLAKLDETIALVRELLVGETVEWRGSVLTLRLGARRAVPILVAGSGPNSLRLAGRVADIALIAVGAAPEIVGSALNWVREGAQSAGRDPSAVECWAYVDTGIAEQGSQAVDEVAGAAVARANIVYRGPLSAELEPGMKPKIEQLMREYDYAEHMKPGRSANYLLAERLGLAEYLLDRFTIAGTPQHCRQHAQRLRETGIHGLCFNLATASDLGASVRLLGQAVLPAARG